MKGREKIRNDVIQEEKRKRGVERGEKRRGEKRREKESSWEEVGL